MEFKVTESQSQHLEATYYEYMALKTLVEALYGSDFPVSPDKLKEVLEEYKKAFYTYNLVFNGLLNQYVPFEKQKGVEFKFNLHCFITQENNVPSCNQCG
jgi:hypothetical protein